MSLTTLRELTIDELALVGGGRSLPGPLPFKPVPEPKIPPAPGILPPPTGPGGD